MKFIFLMIFCKINKHYLNDQAENPSPVPRCWSSGSVSCLLLPCFIGLVASERLEGGNERTVVPRGSSAERFLLIEEKVSGVVS